MECARWLMSLSFLHSRYLLAAMMSEENKEADGPGEEEEEEKKGDTDANLDGGGLLANNGATFGLKRVESDCHCAGSSNRRNGGYREAPVVFHCGANVESCLQVDVP